MDDAGNIATAVEKMQTQMPELKDLLKPANESESGASISTTKTESDRRESERLDSDRADSSKTEGESNETNGSKDLSVSGDRDASSRSSSSRRTRTSSWGWMRSPRDVFANRPPQVSGLTFRAIDGVLRFFMQFSSGDRIPFFYYFAARKLSWVYFGAENI